MEALSNVKSGETCTVKWMFGNPGILEWMDSHDMKEGCEIRVVQNFIGHMIVSVGGSRLALSRDVAERIKV